MQFVRQFDHDRAAPVGWGVRVLLLAAEADDAADRLALRLAGLGGRVKRSAGIGTVLDHCGAGLTDVDLVVIDADAFGGAAVARELLAGMRRAGQAYPSIILSSDCRAQIFPTQIGIPVELRAPLSAVSLRVGFEHAMRHRLLAQVA